MGKFFKRFQDFPFKNYSVEKTIFLNYLNTCDTANNLWTFTIGAPRGTVLGPTTQSFIIALLGCKTSIAKLL